MKLHSAGLAALSLAIALGLSACGGDKQARSSRRPTVPRPRPPPVPR